MLGLPNQVKYARTCALSSIVKYKSRIYLPESNRNGPRCCLQLSENVSRTAAVLLCEWFWQLQHNNVVSGCVQTDKAHRQHLFACVLPRKFSDAVGQTRATIPLEAFSRCRIVITRHHTHTLGYTWPYPYSTYLHSHTHTHTKGDAKQKLLSVREQFDSQLRQIAVFLLLLSHRALQLAGACCCCGSA